MRKRLRISDLCGVYGFLAVFSGVAVLSGIKMSPAYGVRAACCRCRMPLRNEAGETHANRSADSKRQQAARTPYASRGSQAGTIPPKTARNQFMRDGQNLTQRGEAATK